MTKITPADVFNDDLTKRDAFQNQSVWLPMLAVQHWNAGQMVIEGKTFTDCIIEGPAVMAVMAGTQLEGCNLGVAQDPRTLLLKPMGEKIAGVIGMANCRFVRCQFVQVGFTGIDEILSEIERDLLSVKADPQTGVVS